jgi:hypothetical protein
MSCELGPDECNIEKSNFARLRCVAPINNDKVQIFLTGFFQVVESQVKLIATPQKIMGMTYCRSMARGDQRTQWMDVTHSSKYSVLSVELDPCVLA